MYTNGIRVRGRTMGIHKFLCGSLLALSASLGIAAPQPTVADEDLRQGMAAFQAADMMGAMPYLTRAAEKGYAVAQRLLGYILVRGEENAAGVRWYLKAAEQGDGESQLALSEIAFQEKPGVTLTHEEGMAWLQKAVAQQYPEAIYRLAEYKELGHERVKVDAEEAVALFQQAAELGHTNAMARLVRIYRNGELGLEKDPVKADQWQQRLDDTLAGESLKKK